MRRTDGQEGRVRGRSRWLEGLAILPLVLALGCATTGLNEPPELTLVDLQVAEVTMFETSLQARLRISNANPDPLVITGSSFKLSLEGRKVGSGASPDRVEIPRFSSQVVDVEFHVSNASLLLRLREVLQKESVSYGLRGTLYRESSFGTRKLKIRREGRLDLKNLTDPDPQVIEE